MLPQPQRISIRLLLRFEGEAFGVRQLAAAFVSYSQSGSEQPPISEGALRAQKL
jgi:hypothetical protein